MQNNSINRLISADKDFDDLDSIARIDPVSYSLAP